MIELKTSSVKINEIVERPGGYYRVLEWQKNYVLKHIVISINSKISLQLHLLRNELWYVYSGTGLVTLDDLKFIICPDNIILIPRNHIHRLENISNTPLQILELQEGDYIDENDIIRIDDAYGRV